MTQCLKHMYSYISEATEEEITDFIKISKATDAEFMTLVPTGAIIDKESIVQKECPKCLRGDPDFMDSDFAKSALFKSDKGTMCHESTF